MAAAGRWFVAAAAALALAAFSHAAAPARSAIAVMQPVNSCAASERGYASSISKHLVRWLKSVGVAADLVDDTRPDAALSGRRLVYLVMCSSPSAAEVAALRGFTARGGKVVAFYCKSADVASLMGVRFGQYRKPAAGTFARMVFSPGGPAGSPAAIEQSSANICSASALPGRSRVIASWHNRAGRPVGEAAIIASSAGWWVTHVFLADGDEEAKSRFLAACAGVAVPGSWSAAAHAARRKAAADADRAYAAAQKPRPGELHAVWDHSGQGLYPGDWPRTFRLLKAYGITDLFVNVAGAGFAHYPSATLPPSSVFQAQGDQLAACLAAARACGVRVHAWIICFNATRATPHRLGVFERRGWRLRDTRGALTEYLNPAAADLRAYLLSAVDEIARRYAVAGVHLDFVRWYERSAKPQDAARTITGFVSAARARLRAARPGAWLTTAVLATYPSCVTSVGQDWEAWLDTNIVDYIVPMNYTEDSTRFASLVARQGRTRAHAMRVIAGIGVTANESRLSPRKVIDQILLARRAGLAGIAFFDLDHTLVNSILPVLRAGVL